MKINLIQIVDREQRFSPEHKLVIKETSEEIDNIERIWLDIEPDYTDSKIKKLRVSFTIKEEDCYQLFK